MIYSLSDLIQDVHKTREVNLNIGVKTFPHKYMKLSK